MRRRSVEEKGGGKKDLAPGGKGTYVDTGYNSGDRGLNVPATNRDERGNKRDRRRGYDVLIVGECGAWI